MLEQNNEKIHTSNGAIPKLPRFIRVEPEDVPVSLRKLPQWACWKFDYRPTHSKPWSKPPFDINTGWHANCADPHTWYSFGEVMERVKRGEYAGISFALTEGICGIDIDNCITDGKLEPWAQDIVDRINSYTEFSPSGTGVRIFCRASVSESTVISMGGSKVEIYGGGKFLTVTGARISQHRQLMDRQQEVESLIAFLKPDDEEDEDGEPGEGKPGSSYLSDDEVLQKLLYEEKGCHKWRAVWAGDTSYHAGESEADMGLVEKLCFYCNNDATQVDRLFRKSGLMREKWDEKHYRDEPKIYGARLIKKCIAHTKTTYKPPVAPPPGFEQDLENILGSGTAGATADGEPAAEISPEPAAASSAPARAAPEPAPAEEPEPAGIDHAALWEAGKLRKYRFAPIDSATFAAGYYKPQWLVERLLVKGQPAIVGGPKKSLKTSLLVDLTVSLGAGVPFLDNFSVVQPTRTVLLSGESGNWTLQETANRVCASKGLRLADLRNSCLWDFKLPQLSKEDDLTALTQGLKAYKVEVAIIDPLYLCLLSGQGAAGKNAANLFDMGPLLLQVAAACLEAECTPMLVHHAKKYSNDGYNELDLEDLAFAGIQEFARQWILLSRRAKYSPGTGYHRLWLTCGGSCGQGGLWGVDIREDVLKDDFTGRKWDVEVMSLEDAKEVDSTHKEGKKKAADLKAETELLAALDTFEQPPAKSSLKRKLNWYEGKFTRIFEGLIADKRIELQTVKRVGGNGAKQEVEVVIPCPQKERV